MRSLQKWLGSGSNELDKQLKREIADECKANPESIRDLWKVLNKNLQKPHSQVRYCCLLVIDYLFQKSHLFRSILLENGLDFLKFSMTQLPFPHEYAVKTQQLAMQLISGWKVSFPGYPQLQILFQHAQDKPMLTQEPMALRDPRKERLKAVRLEKYQQVREQFQSIDLESQLQELESLLLLIVPDIAEHHEHIEPDIASSTNEGVKKYGLGTLSYKLEIEITRTKVQRTEENSALFDALQEKLTICDKHKERIQKWLEITSQAEDEDKERHESFLKQLIDCKSRLVNGIAKGRELLQQTWIASDNEDDGFDDVPVVKEKLVQKEQKPLLLMQDPGVAGFKSVFSSIVETEQVKEEEVISQNNELYKIAPVVPYASDLDYWSKTELTFDEASLHQGMEYHHRFLGERLEDRKVSKETLDGLRKRSVYLQPKKPEHIRECGAPLANGQRCRRRDLTRCPVHGRILMRDETGKALEEPDMRPKTPLWERLQDDVAAQLQEGPKLMVNPKDRKTAKDRIAKKLKSAKHDGKLEDLVMRDRMAFRW